LPLASAGARASIKFARFAQAMSKTSPEIPRSNHREVSESERNSENPVLAEKRAELIFEILLRSFGIVNRRNGFLQNGRRDREDLGVGARNGPSRFSSGRWWRATRHDGALGGLLARTKYGLNADRHSNVKGVAYGKYQ